MHNTEDGPSHSRCAAALLQEAPHHAVLTGRDGRPCRVWLNPHSAAFGDALRRSARGGSLDGLRGLLTGVDLYVWQSTHLLHADFERESGVQGVRVALRSGSIQANDETVAQPEAFPWVFPDPGLAANTDVEDRRTVVCDWLKANTRLAAIYPEGFNVTWYH